MWRQHVFILTILKSNEPNEAKWFKRWILSAQIVWLEDKHILLRWSLLRGHVKFCGGHIIRILYIYTHPSDEFSSHGIVGTQKIEVMYIFGGSGSHFGLLTKFGKKDFHRFVAFFFFLFSQGVVFHDADDSKGTQAEAFTSGVFKERPLRFPRTSRVHRSCDKKSLLICMHSYKFTQLLNNDNSSKIRCNSGLSPFFSFGSSLFDDRGHRFLNRWKVTPTNVTFASSASKPKCGGCCPTLWRRLFWWLEVCKLARCEGCSRGRF